MKRLVAILVWGVVWGVLAFAPHGARAEASASELLRLYDEGGPQDRRTFELVLDGNANGISWMNSYLGQVRGDGHQAYCAPEDFNPQGADLLHMLRTAIDEGAAYGDMPYGMALLFLLIDRYPCP